MFISVVTCANRNEYVFLLSSQYFFNANSEVQL